MLDQLCGVLRKVLPREREREREDSLLGQRLKTVSTTRKERQETMQDMLSDSCLSKCFFFFWWSHMMGQHLHSTVWLIALAWDVGVFTLLGGRGYLGKCFTYAPTCVGQCGTGVRQVGLRASPVSPQGAPQHHTH